MLPPVKCRADDARWVLAALAGFALLFAPGTDEGQADRPGGREPIQARILAPTVSEALVAVARKPSDPDLRSGVRSRPVALPLGAISVIGAIFLMWAVPAGWDRSRIRPRGIVLSAHVPRGPPAVQPI